MKHIIIGTLTRFVWIAFVWLAIAYINNDFNISFTDESLRFLWGLYDGYAGYSYDGGGMTSFRPPRF